jgi:2,3-dihydroxy-p-cumate/2,3-dihydroxybenzoate 3,4-dioxygenase
VGLEVRYLDDLDAAIEGLHRLGLSAMRGSAEDCALRKVKDMAWFADFSGNRIELVVRPLNSGWRFSPVGTRASEVWPT